jgi:ABC-2 type transport system ATP-binding protein
MSDSEILILDEPVNDLDPMGRREILEIIGSLRGDKTVLMSTHVLNDVDRVCTSVGIINQGKLLVNSTIEALRDRHARPVFSIDVDGDLAGLAAHLAATDYIASVRSLPDGLRVVARDEARARRELPALVVASGLVLNSYRLERPSLKDIFVELVAGDESP